MDYSSLFKGQESEFKTFEGKERGPTYIIFDLNENSFLCPINEIIEIIEMVSIIPYPIEITGHLGIINLRGNIIPVITPFGKETIKDTFFNKDHVQKLRNDKYRILIFEDSEAKMFGVIGRNVRKIHGESLPERDEKKESEKDTGLNVIGMSGRPIKYFYPNKVITNY